MGSFGERLQREREMRGISLDEIAEATKIGTRSLRALEEQDFDKLPGGIFNKGFVRAYSRYLGLDEEQAVADYQAALSEAQAAGKVTRPDSTASPATPERAILMAKIEDSEPTSLPLGLIAVVVVLAVALFAGWKYYAKNGLPKLRHVRAAAQQTALKPAAQTPAEPRLSGGNAVQAGSPTENALAPATSGTSATQPRASSANPVQGSDSAPRPGAGGLQQTAVAGSQPRTDAQGVRADQSFVVRIKAKQDTWISIVADGKPMMSGILPLAAERKVRAQHNVVLRTGNAAGLELFHNDKLVSPIGGAGEVKDVEFTAAGLRNKPDSPDNRSPLGPTKPNSQKQ